MFLFSSTLSAVAKQRRVLQHEIDETCSSDCDSRHDVASDHDLRMADTDGFGFDIRRMKRYGRVLFAFICFDAPRGEEFAARALCMFGADDGVWWDGGDDICWLMEDSVLSCETEVSIRPHCCASSNEEDGWICSIGVGGCASGGEDEGGRGAEGWALTSQSSRPWFASDELGWLLSFTHLYYGFIIAVLLLVLFGRQSLRHHLYRDTGNVMLNVAVGICLRAVHS